MVVRTGYGRDYRRRLRGAWGIVDIDDVCAGALYLVKQGLADAKRLAIDGGSAGGYTTLVRPSFPRRLHGGLFIIWRGRSRGVGRGYAQVRKSRYLDGLVGRYPEDEKISTLNGPLSIVWTS